MYTLSTGMQKQICGATQENNNTERKPTVNISGSGSEYGARGEISVSYPIVPNVNIQAKVTGNTDRGVNEGWLSGTYNF